MNEETHLARCLESISWCDEIVLVDGGSSDSSKEIALDPTAPWFEKIRWIDRKWDGFKNQRNHSLDQAKHEWVFCIDADEACSPSLRLKIEETLSSPSPHPYWKVRRQEYFLGRPINHGVWNPSYQDRLFNKTGIRFVNEIHEYPAFPEKPLRIHEPIHHDPGFRPEKFLAKMNKYSTIDAKARLGSGQRTNLFRVLTTGPAMFFKNYFYYRSYKDGAHGLIISLLEGVSRVVRHIKMWELQEEKNRS